MIYLFPKRMSPTHREVTDVGDIEGYNPLQTVVPACGRVRLYDWWDTQRVRSSRHAIGATFCRHRTISCAIRQTRHACVGRFVHRQGLCPKPTRRLDCHERTRLRAQADDACAPSPLAVQALAFPPRPALARARATQTALVLARALPFGRVLSPSTAAA